MHSEHSHHNNLKLHQSPPAFPRRNITKPCKTQIMWKTLLIGAFLAGAFTSCESIFCYSCSSLGDPDCETPEKLQKVACGPQAMRMTGDYAKDIDDGFSKIFDFHLEQDHESKVPFNCFKQVTTANNQVIVLRGCQLPKDNKQDVCKKILGMDYKNKLQVTHCSLCDEDECNVSIRNVVDIKLLLAIAIFKLIF